MKIFFTKLIEYLGFLLYRSKCLNCNIDIITPNSLCGTCWKNISFIDSHICDICSKELKTLSKTVSNICVDCIKNKPYYDKLRYVCKYDEGIRKIIQDFKYRDKIYLNIFLGNLLYKKFQELQTTLRKEDEAIDYIIAVPMYKKKLRKRMYNQAILLAKYIGKKSNIEVLYNILERKKLGKSQVYLTQKERLKNVKNLYSLNKKILYNNKKGDRKETTILDKKNILLIDDTITTGATINNISKLLKNYNIGKLYVFSIARVQ